MARTIFVFDSNLSGKHGAGDSGFALANYGAVYGQSEGLQGESYAIPTHDKRGRPLPLDKIEMYVKRFIGYANRHPEYRYTVSTIGYRAGYTFDQIAPMFEDAPPHVQLPSQFRALLGRY